MTTAIRTDPQTTAGRRRRAALIVLVVLLATAMSLGSLPAVKAWALDALVRVMRYEAAHAQGDLLVVLAIGSDEGPPHRAGNPLDARADGIHLLAVDTAASRMTIVDIPRDSAIGGTKVNAHLAFGGPERLEAQLEAWSGVQIDYWVLGSFWSLEQLAGGMGGVMVDVPTRMRNAAANTDLQPGPQVLDAAQALAFTRDRKSLPDGDVGRSRNQGLLIRAALEQIRRTTADNPAELLRLVQLLQRSTAHNIPPTEVLPLALAAVRIPPENIRQDTITGPIGSIGGSSVIRPQPGDVLARLQAGQVGP